MSAVLPSEGQPLTLQSRLSQVWGPPVAQHRILLGPRLQGSHGGPDRPRGGPKAAWGW